MVRTGSKKAGNKLKKATSHKILTGSGKNLLHIVLFLLPHLKVSLILNQDAQRHEKNQPTFPNATKEKDLVFGCDLTVVTSHF